MALTFDFTDMIASLGQAEYDRLTKNPTDTDQWHPVTEALIFNMMVIQMRNITGKNVDEVWWRTAFRQRLDGPMFSMMGIGQFYLSRKDIENHRGLQTNVPTRSRLDFIKSFTDHWKPSRYNTDDRSAFAISCR